MTVHPPIHPVVSVEEIDAAWLTKVLRAGGELPEGEVADVAIERVGHGQAADSYRLALTYAGGSGPASLIGKFTSSDARSARTGGYGLYEGEVRFYRELAPTLPVRTPRALAAAIEPASSRFVLIMEDLSPALPVDQLVGLTPDQAALALEQAAGLHAASWHSAGLARRSWLTRVRRGMLAVADALPTLDARLEAGFADVIDAEDLATAARLIGLVDPLKRVLDDPVALWHQDFRADNLLFGALDGQVPVAVLDWQTVTFGPALADVSLLLGGSLRTPVRREHERDLVRHYYDALVAGGVTAYSYDDCWNDYRVMAITGVFNGINGPVQVRRTDRGDRLWSTWLSRHCAQALDLGTYDLLSAR